MAQVAVLKVLPEAVLQDGLLRQGQEARDIRREVRLEVRRQRLRHCQSRQRQSPRRRLRQSLHRLCHYPLHHQCHYQLHLRSSHMGLSLQIHPEGVVILQVWCHPLLSPQVL